MKWCFKMLNPINYLLININFNYNFANAIFLFPSPGCPFNVNDAWTAAGCKPFPFCLQPVPIFSNTQHALLGTGDRSVTGSKTLSCYSMEPSRRLRGCRTVCWVLWGFALVPCSANCWVFYTFCCHRRAVVAAFCCRCKRLHVNCEQRSISISGSSLFCQFVGPIKLY